MTLPAILTQPEYRELVASQMTEATLQQRVEALCRELRRRYYHAPDNRPGRNGRVQHITPGFPDLVIVAPGPRLVYAELKTQRGRQSPEQREWAADLEACGAEVYLWRPIDYLDGTIRAVLTRGA